MTPSLLEEQIKHILSLPPDFDDERSPAYTRETVDKALRYIPLMKEELRQKKNIVLGDPYVWPGPKGSIDVFWATKDFELLLNVPLEEERAEYCLAYFKDDKKDEWINGELKL